MSAEATCCKKESCDTPLNPCACKEDESSSSSSSQSEKELIEETVKETVEVILDELEERQQTRDRFAAIRRIPQKYIYYGAVALPWTLLLLEQVDFGACPWLNSTFSWQ